MILLLLLFEKIYIPGDLTIDLIENDKKNTLKRFQFNY